MSNHYPHYFKSVKHLSHVDVYRVLDLFGVTSPPLQHAIKKLLVAGGRGSKDVRHDIEEAIVSCERALDMLEENAKAVCISSITVTGPDVLAAGDLSVQGESDA